MKRKPDKNKLELNTPKWTRRGFGIFAALVTAAGLLWKPKIMRKKPEVSGAVADHWKPLPHKKG